MSKKKKILIVILVLLFVCGLGSFLFVKSQKQTEVDKEPDDATQEVISVPDSDIDVGEYEEYDWESEAEDTINEKDFSHNNQTQDDADNQQEEETEDDGIGLRHDESKNEGIEVDFDSWD